MIGFMDVQKTMEFILEQQAATAANLQEFKARMAKLSGEIATLRAFTLQREDVSRIRTERRTELAESMKSLTDTIQAVFPWRPSASAKWPPNRRSPRRT